MRRNIRCVATVTVLCLALLSGVAGTAAAQSSEDGERYLLSPDEAELAGFSRDAVIFGVLSRSLLEAGSDAERRQRNPGGGPVAHRGYSGRMFQERVSTTSFTTGSVGAEGISCTSGPPFFDVQLQLPQESRLLFVDVFGLDTCAEDLEVFVQRSCQPYLSPATPVLEILASGSSSSMPGDFVFVIALATPIDNTLCDYWLRARFDDGSASCSCGADLELQKARALFEYPNEGVLNPTGAADP